MDKVNVIFSYEGGNITIQCSKEDKMKDICQNFAVKIQVNMNFLLFLYEGSQLNLELSFNEQATLIDRNNGLMKILVCKNEDNEFICPKCWEKIKLNTEKINNIILSYNNIKETIAGIIFQIENIINNSLMNSVNIQLKNINLLLNNINEEIQNNNEKLKNFYIDINNNEFFKKNKIKGVIDIESNEINKNIVLFKYENSEGVEVYLNNKKINIIKDDYEWKYNFTKEGKYPFEIIFYDKINNFTGFFDECSHVISLDLTNFISTDITDISFMLSGCIKLKEIKGINKFNTTKVKDMRGMFQKCYELEYLDLSNFDTSNVTNMECMFAGCHKLKEIKGINKFNTIRVKDMRAMFRNCYELEKLDLSNFDTKNVTIMSFMFKNCNKLKYLNLLNFSIYCVTRDMFSFKEKKKCKFITNNKNLLDWYKSS